MPIDWATKDEPQMMAVIRSKIIPLGVVRRIYTSLLAREIYINAVGFARKRR
jgi:hypothetical protein